MQSPAGANFQWLFESAPGLYLVLMPDLSILAASDAYLQATMTKRGEILGRNLFDVFPDNPDDPAATGVSNLRASLNYVLQNREAHTMAVQKYDIRRPDGSFEERFWSPLNKPVFNDKNELVYIIHRVEDVTEFVRLKRNESRQQQQTETMKRQLEEMETEVYKRAQEIQEINKKLLGEIQERQKAEEKFRGLLESAPDAMIIAGKKGEIVLVNQQTEVLFGYNKSELINQPVEMLIPHDLRQRHQGHRTDYYKEPRVRSMGVGLELYAVRKDGSQFPVEISLSPLATTEGMLVSAAIRDITDRKKSEAIIQRQRQDIQDFIDSMSTLCAKVAKDGTLLMVNKTALMATGLSMEELLQTNFLEGNWWAYDAAVQRRVKDAFAKACAGTTINYDETIFVFGQELTINFSLIPILAVDESVDYIVAEGRDITSLKLTEAALQKQTQQLEKVNKELEGFSYSVSHDLRAPLRIIDGYTGMVVNDYSNKVDEEGKRMFGIITENVRKMGQLIDDLLNLSRLGRKELVVHPIDMNQMVASVLTEQLSQTTKHYHVETAELEPADADGSLLRQVWVNLISNAIKYTGGREKPSIEINSGKTANEIIYTIKDNGVGFNMKYADKLFGVFQRLHKMNEFEGTGVGLALVQQIISRHGGRVWAEAEVDKGATFFFGLPLIADKH
ncbi:PAS domain-containing sensor histidine kinase [Terrimonas pollutisoli]|uniref:PAS domain-containing sensor histidine kinase n=1 Tax=Terrimonas pollutisoli TaxID=3034147 RepID=UPI0023EBFE1F|nr:PAS domain S-box protein [Terrimonas sp. H1YJ31]